MSKFYQSAQKVAPSQNDEANDSQMVNMISTVICQEVATSCETEDDVFHSTCVFVEEREHVHVLI